MNFDLMQLVCLAAEQAKQPQPPSMLTMFFPLIAIGFLWYFLMFRPQKEEQARRDDMLKQLKKNDRVVTVGGIIGTIANVVKDSAEVTIKVDDNTRLKVLRTHIVKVLSDTKPEQQNENS